MAGVGRFKMTDALPPEQRTFDEPAQPGDLAAAGSTGRAGKGRGKAKAAGKAGKGSVKSLDSEQVREARESARPRMPRPHRAIGWSTSAAATSRQAARREVSYPVQRRHRPEGSNNSVVQAAAKP